MDEVETMMTEARRKGVNGVPFVVIDGKWAVSGGQTAEVYTQVSSRMGKRLLARTDLLAQIFKKLAQSEAAASTPKASPPRPSAGVPVAA